MFKIFVLTWALLANTVGANGLASKIEQPYVDRSSSGTVVSDETINTLPQPLPPPKLANAMSADISADSYLLYDTSSATVLAEKNGYQKRPFASTIKLMTILLIVENQDLSSTVTISHNAATQPGSTMALREGEKLTVKDLLYGLMLPSGNDAAMALAELDGGEIAFVAKMNARAKQLGLAGTHYNDPAGLDEVGTTSTAYDMAKLLAFDIKNSTIADIIKTYEITITDQSGKITHKLQNSNRLIKDNYPGILGGKTGTGTYGSYKDDNGNTIIGAGHCLVTAAQRNGYKLVAVIAATASNSHDASSTEAKKLLDFGFANIQPQQNVFNLTTISSNH